MPETVLATITVNATGATETNAWTVHVNAENPSNTGWSVTVDGDDDAIAAAIARRRVDRWRVQIDLGAGFEYIAPREVAVSSISSSLDTWAKTATLEFHGSRWSPDLMGAMRGLVPVVIEQTIGELGAPITREQFRGIIVTSAWDAAARVLRCEALDDAGRVAETTIAPYLAPDSGKTRDGYAIELIEDAGLSVGRIDSGPLGLTEIAKPVSKVDVPLWEFLRDWYAPCGAWVYNRDGVTHVERWSDIMPVAAEIRPNDVVSVPQFTPPAALAVNKVTAVAIDYSRVESTGTRTIQFSERTYEDYAVKGAVAKQDKSTGNVTVVSYGDAATSYRETRRILTRQTYRGDMLISSRVEEYGYRATRIARQTLGTDGTTVSHLTTYDCYQFEDDNWYMEPREKWGIIRISTMDKTVSGSIVTTVDEKSYFPIFKEYALFYITTSPLTENVMAGGPRPMLEDSRGVEPAWEEMSYLYPSSRALRTFTVDGDGYVTSETLIEYEYTLGTHASSQRAQTRVQGFDASSKTYWTENNAQLREMARVETTYQKVDEQNYVVTETKTDTINARRVTSVTYGRGARPRPEEVQNETRSQESRHSATDEVREFLSGQTIEEAIQSEYCQTNADIHGLAIGQLQRQSAWMGSVVLPLSHVLREGHYASLIGWEPWGLTVNPMRCLVWGVALDPVGKTKTVTLMYLPPEVDRS